MWVAGGKGLASALRSVARAAYEPRAIRTQSRHYPLKVLTSQLSAAGVVWQTRYVEPSGWDHRDGQASGAGRCSRRPGSPPRRRRPPT